jgi:hypothetical protein
VTLAKAIEGEPKLQAEREADPIVGAALRHRAASSKG